MEDSVKHCTEPTICSNNTGKLQNKRGRPVKSKNIQFGPQPTSIISQLLRKNVKKLVKHNNITNEQVPTIVEGDKKDEDTNFLCVVCSLRMSNKKEYKKHLKIHKNYSCKFPECNYTTKLSSNLIKHKRKHTSEKPYLCDQCTFRTNFINSLKVHKRIHTEERPYACKHCSYKCNSSSNLKKHCQYRHLKNIP
ncbi:PREDICTED: zinc finger protein 271-like [Papilio xuthus]|uniref:Zinc finger protein 271-like n=1 Tax=Papilio xuthus TaxID=66420 RepID=A0AAJ7E8K4_PAPXU|nr:PREDICTED: zinc finger protein 271-like [Papilio xuthus]